MAATLDDLRPHDLRHAFVSLLITGGRTVIEVARQAGHSPTTTLATYGQAIGVIEELEGPERGSAEELIRQARELHVPSGFPQPRKHRAARAARLP